MWRISIQVQKRRHKERFNVEVSQPLDQMTSLRKRVLFVDDERGIRETLSLILLRHGFTVTVAENVQQAVQQIEAQDFDLLLCDLNLERERDGYTVIRAMRDVHPRCVTVILTGHPDLESAMEGIHLGVLDYVTKPTNPHELVALLTSKLTARELAKS
jgi:DNA-binding NtrC family response regulator